MPTRQEFSTKTCSTPRIGQRQRTNSTAKPDELRLTETGPAPARSAPPVAKTAPLAPFAPPATVAPHAAQDARALELARQSAEQKSAASEAKVKPQADALRGVVGPVTSAPAEPQRQANMMPYPRPEPLPQQVEQGRDQFETFAANPIKQVAQEPVSTFSLDVDTASYSIVRRALNGGRLPHKDMVRVEEMINYFPYDYARPETASAPFQPQITVMPSPWNPANKLVHVGIKGYALNAAQRPRANLVFLIDISGSMGPEDRLPLLKNAFRMLVDQLKPDDTVGIVTYASGSDVRLYPTKASEKGKILSAIDSLRAGGSTAGANGIQDAYKVAESHFDKGGVNRIILGTDGDFNVGITDRNQLKSYIEQKRDSGVFLSILGVGMGNHNDALMQTLARNGNGVAAYIDTLAEARKVLVEEASSSIFPIAKDVKVQLEFNPATVSAYRLVGYEKRMLRREDFNNDKVDAGDVGSGHTVTAIYEITPAGAPASVDALRYAAPAVPAAAPPSTAGTGEFGFLKLRYKLPSEEASKLLSLPITPALEQRTIAEAPADVRFSIAVAGFGQLLRGSPYLKTFAYDDVIALASSARGDDPFGYRAEFINLVRLAKSARP